MKRFERTRRWAAAMAGIVVVTAIFVLALVGGILANGWPAGVKDWAALPTWLLSPPNPWFVLNAAMSALGAASAFAGFLGSKSASPEDVARVGRKIDDLSKQVSDEGEESEQRDAGLMAAVLKDRVGFTPDDIRNGRISDAAKAEFVAALRQTLQSDSRTSQRDADSFAVTAGDLAQSASPVDREVAAAIAEGSPITAADQLMAAHRTSNSENAERARQAARLYAPFSVVKAITAYAAAIDLEPDDVWTLIELRRLHELNGSPDLARQCAERAEQLATDPREAMVAQNELGNVAYQAGDYTLALFHYERAFEETTKLKKAYPDNDNVEHDVIVSHGNVAKARNSLGYPIEEVEAEVKLALDIAERGVNRVTDQDIFHSSFCSLLELLGDIKWKRGDNDEAIEYFEKSLRGRQWLDDAEPNLRRKRGVSLCHERLGSVHLDMGEIDKAETELRKSLEIDSEIAASDLDNIQYQRDLLISHIKLADFGMRSGNVAIERAELDGARATATRIIDRWPQNLAVKDELAWIEQRMARMRSD